jgi:hypothetical protein
MQLVQSLLVAVFLLLQLSAMLLRVAVDMVRVRLLRHPMALVQQLLVVEPVVVRHLLHLQAVVPVVLPVVVPVVELQALHPIKLH